MHQGRIDRNNVILAIKFRLVLNIAGIAVAPIFFSGCFKSESFGLPASSSTSEESNAIQKNRSAIVMAFIENQTSATAKYKAEWQKLQGAHEPTERTNIASKLAIAGQLIAADPENYSEYYSYVINHMPAGDWELREIALSGLGNSKGPESIALLFKELNSPDSLMISSAVTAIDFRYKTSLDDPSLHEDVLDIKQRSAQLCSAKTVNRHIEKYCEEHHFSLDR
jgi:hypothetical protein